MDLKKLKIGETVTAKKKEVDSVTFEKYKELHPKTKKTKDDPMFKTEKSNKAKRGDAMVERLKTQKSEKAKRGDAVIERLKKSKLPTKIGETKKSKPRKTAKEREADRKFKQEESDFKRKQIQDAWNNNRLD